MTLNNEPTEPLAALEPEATQLPRHNLAQPPQNERAKLRRLFIVGSVLLVVILLGVIGTVFALQLRPSTASQGSTPKTVSASPSRVPHATPTVASASSALVIDYQNESSNPTSNQIQMGLALTNTGSSPITLTGVTIRYWYTADNSQAQVFACDYATIDCANVQSQFVRLSPSQPTADTYLEISFTSGVLAANASTQIQLRIHQSNWLNYNQSNDYSFDPTAKTSTSTQHIGVYNKGVLVSGSAPA
jgi:hypothetical protein